MSIYKPKTKISDFLPKPNFSDLKGNDKLKTIFGIVIGVIVLFGIILILINMDFNISSGIGITWNNNPLNLTENKANYSELILNLKNTDKEVRTINLQITTPSKELIIFCPTKIFENVAPGNYREVRCIIRKDPNHEIYTGEYNINILTNLSKTTTNLKVIN
jgi:hypothetical protein